MEATDLMIGDWVMYNPNVFIDDEYEPYAPLEPNKIESGEDIDLAMEGCYTPIPLTAEILEMNGWKRNIDEEWKYNNSHILPNYCYQFRRGSIKIEMEANRNGFTISGIIGHRFYAVHELQHALRLCGLDGLADNFKI